MRSQLERQALDLLWSAWTELGVAGVVRNHTRVAIDPEPLIVFSPWFADRDARLRDELHRWCAEHTDWVSTTRLGGLLAKVPPEVRAAFGSLSEALSADAVRWPASEGAAPWPRPPVKGVPTLQLVRPSLIRFRLRALCGVGTRADVLAELLSGAAPWLRASQLEELGYSRRNVARVLTDLASSGFLRQRTERNALAFQLGDRQSWSSLLGVPVAWPSWFEVLAFVKEILTFADAQDKPEPVRRVDAAGARERLAARADRLGLASPPLVRGEVEAWSLVAAWCDRQLAELATGSSAVFQGPELARSAS